MFIVFGGFLLLRVTLMAFFHFGVSAVPGRRTGGNTRTRIKRMRMKKQCVLRRRFVSLMQPITQKTKKHFIHTK